MLVRFALVALAVAGLASPVGAQETTSETAQAQNDGASVDNVGPARPKHRSRARRADTAATASAADAGDSGAEAEVADETPLAAKPKKAVAAKAKVVSVLPPARPSESEQASTTQISGAQASGAPILTASPEALARTASAEGATGLAAEFASEPPSASIGGKTPMFLSIVLPLRPSLESDGAAAPVETAKAEETPTPATPADGIGAPTGKFVSVMPPMRPSFSWDADKAGPLPGEIAAVEPAQEQPAEAPAPQQQQQPGLLASLFGPGFPTPAQASLTPAPDFQVPMGRSDIDALVVKHARLNGVPVALVRRVVMRESRYNPRAIGRGGALGLMQIKHNTARALGYTGPASGLLNAETNLTYAVKYLAGAYRTAGGDFSRAVAYYARGYYNAAKHAGTLLLAERNHGLHQEAEARAEDLTAAQ